MARNSTKIGAALRNLQLASFHAVDKHDPDVADIGVRRSRLDERTERIEPVIGVVTPKIIGWIQLPAFRVFNDVSIGPRACGIRRSILAIGSAREYQDATGAIGGESFDGRQDQLLIAPSEATLRWLDKSNRRFATADQAIGPGADSHLFGRQRQIVPDIFGWAFRGFSQLDARHIA